MVDIENDREFNNFLKGQRSKLLARAMTLTLNRSEAEDLVQITMEKIFKNISKLDEIQNFLPWSYTILRNSFIDIHRSKKNINLKSMSDLENYEENDEKFSKDDIKSVTSHLSQENDLIIREKVEFTMNLIANLKPHQRDIINMKRNGSSYEEIARTLNLKMGTVMSSLSRIREHISDEWEKHINK